MSNNQLMRKATLTASFVGIVGLSSLLSVKASHAASFQLDLPLENFTFVNDASIAPADNSPFGHLLTGSYILFPGTGIGTAISGSSPSVNPKTKQSVLLHFDYIFAPKTDTEEDTKFKFSLRNDTTGEITFSRHLIASPEKLKQESVDLTKKFTAPGVYSIIYDFSGAGGVAGVTNFALKIKTVPEPTTTLGLLALGMGAVTLKRKGKISLGVLSKSAS